MKKKAKKEIILLPCPFCGRSASALRFKYFGNYFKYYVKCPSHLHRVETKEYTTREAAAKVWNTRSQKGENRDR